MWARRRCKKKVSAPSVSSHPITRGPGAPPAATMDVRAGRLQTIPAFAMLMLCCSMASSSAWCCPWRRQRCPFMSGGCNAHISRPLPPPCPPTHPHLVKLVNAAAALVAKDQGTGLERVIARDGIFVERHGQACIAGRVAADVHAARRQVAQCLQHLCKGCAAEEGAH